MQTRFTFPAAHGAEYIVRRGTRVTHHDGSEHRIWTLLYRAAPHLGATVEGRVHMPHDATERDAAKRFGVLPRNQP